MVDSIDVVYGHRHPPIRPMTLSPAGRKLPALAARWRASPRPLTWHESGLATEDELMQVHDPRYVEGVISQRIPDGLGSSDPKWSLEEAGSMIYAAQLCAQTQRSVCAISQGGHHAAWGSAYGYCTFNGVALAAWILAATGRQVAIIDLDRHPGDGTRDILNRLRPVRVAQYSSGEELRTPAEVPAWIRRLGKICTERMASADVVIYHSGVDPHILDPLGGFLTTEQIRWRERLVFACAQRRGIPVLWVQGGGYQTPLEGTLALHDMALDAALEYPTPLAKRV